MASVKESTNHLPSFGHICYAMGGTASRLDRYERPHCIVSLVILSFGFYPNYTRFAPGKLQLSSYGATLWRRSRPPTYLNLLRPSGHLRPKYCAAPGSMSQRSHRATLSQTLYKVPLANNIIVRLPLTKHPNDTGCKC